MRIGQTVYVNRPQNNAYAEGCTVEHAAAKNLYIARAALDGWAHFFTPHDVGNEVFFSRSDAIRAAHSTNSTNSSTQ